MDLLSIKKMGASPSFLLLTEPIYYFHSTIGTVLLFVKISVGLDLYSLKTLGNALEPRVVPSMTCGCIV